MAVTTEMEPIAPPGRLTEDEFVAWCQRFEKIRAEWVDGEVVIMSPVNAVHMRIGEFLLRLLADYVEARDLGEAHGGEFTHRFRAGTRLLRRVPDLWFLSKERLHLLQPTYLDGPPDLALEIVSPDSEDRDYHDKREEYQAAGVLEYWIVDPINEAVVAFRRDAETSAFTRIPESADRLDSAVVPGFFLKPEWLWRKPLPKVAEVLREFGI